jgi:hypothetical protein
MCKIAIIILTAAAVVTVANPATAASKGKKLTLDQAWALCKAQVDRTIPRDNHSARYAAGGACLLKHGNYI